MKFTIAIPTFNRLPQLRQAVNAIRLLELPAGLQLHIAISNIASSDGTRDFLDSLELPGITVHKYNIPYWELRYKKDIRSNWVRLAGIVPRESDWVWLHGDDDIILDPRALYRVMALTQRAEKPQLLLFPQAKRSKNTGQFYTGQLMGLCQAYGFHEMLGWMSQLVMCGPLFFAAMSDFARFSGESLDNHDPLTEDRLSDGEFYVNADPHNADNLTSRGVSAFHHASMVLRNGRNHITIFSDIHVIDEQSKLPPGQEDRATRRHSENVRDRFFFLVDDLVEYLYLPSRSLSPNFLRYVNKSLVDLMINILAEDVLTEIDRQLPKERKIDRLYQLHDLIDNNILREKITKSLQIIERAMHSGSIDSILAVQTLYDETKKPQLPFEIMYT